MLISDEYRQELLNYFPCLPKKDIYYQLLIQATVVNLRNAFPELMTYVDYNNGSDDDNGYYKWKLAKSVLKRVDDIENDWIYSVIPQTSIYGFLECPVLQNSKCVTLDNWVDKSKYIPTIPLPPLLPFREISQETNDKIQLDSAVMDRLTSFIAVYDKNEQTTLSKPTCANTSLTQIDVPSQPQESSSQGIDLYAASFLSQSYINDFKAIYQQKTSTKSKETCELNHFRFKF